MDKNTITGLVLIALVLIVFTFLSRPTEEQIAAQQRYYDSIAQVEKHEAELKAKQQAALINEDNTLNHMDSTSTFFQASQGTDQEITLENELTKLTISTKGGTITQAIIKGYKEQDKQTPVTLFKGEDASLNFLFFNQKEIIQTKDYFFSPVNRSDSSVTMRLQASIDSYIDFKYTVHPQSYLVDLTIQAVGMQGKLAGGNKKVNIEWHQRARQIERGYTYENRLAELTYKTPDDVDELSANKDVEKTVEEAVTWIAFKNQFFSSVFITDSGFNETKLTSKLEQRDSGYIKDYSADMNTEFDPTGAKASQLYFYFGPNHYKILSSLDHGRDKDWNLNRLVYLGWPLIRWINQFFTINIFDWLTKLGLHMGWVLLIITLIVKLVVFPATYKTYLSSAKTKALKPKVDEINKKYPNQEDAMKKQQEIMTLYNQYRANPMGGCLPMLIQFPILMAMFLFVPSAIELRQQSFLWADDLSTYDAIISFPFHIPFLGSHLSLFCLLMTITNTMYTMYTMKMQDNGANPQMAAMKWMSILMPIMFLFILNDYPAGLNYYYFLSTLISVLTMTIMRRMTNEEKLLAQLEANKKTVNEMRNAGGFAGRLQEMQKRQEELMRQRAEQQKKRNN